MQTQHCDIGSQWWFDPMICNLDKSTPYSGLGKLFKKFFSGKIISSYRI